MKRLNQGGYTLIEIVVAMTLLVALMAMVISLIGFSLRLNAQATALRNVQQNTRSAVESMFRQIRLAQGLYDQGMLAGGTNEECKLPRGFDPSGGERDYLVIKTPRNEVFRYRISSESLVEENYGKCGSFPSGPIVTKLTSDTVIVCSLRFDRDNKAQAPRPPYTGYPPAVVRLIMKVATPGSCVGTLGFGQDRLTIEQTISLRGEFSNFFNQP